MSDVAHLTKRVEKEKILGMEDLIGTSPDNTRPRETIEQMEARLAREDNKRYLDLRAKDPQFGQCADEAALLPLPEHGNHKGLLATIHSGNWADFKNTKPQFSAPCPKGKECGLSDSYSFMYYAGSWSVNR